MATGLRVSSITRKFESKSTSRIIAILGLSQNSSTLDRLLGQWARLHQEEDDNKQSFQANTPSLSMSCHTLSLRSYNVSSFWSPTHSFVLFNGQDPFHYSKLTP